MITDINKLNVLVVDDDIFMRDLISTTLSAIGVNETTTVGCGQDALDLLKGSGAGFNLLMSDLYMPDMDGIEFLDFAKESGFDGDIVLFSGVNRKILDQAGKLAAAKQIKILGCLEKPISQEDLKNLLTQR